MMSRIFLPALILGLSGCAISGDSPYARASEPHAIVDLDIPKPAHDLHQAFFLELNGRNVVGERQQMLLKPGRHTLKLGAIFSEYAGLMPSIGRDKKDAGVITLDVKAGTRYTLAAKLDTRNSDDWQAVVTKEAPIGR